MFGPYSAEAEHACHAMTRQRHDNSSRSILVSGLGAKNLFEKRVIFSYLSSALGESRAENAPAHLCLED